MYLSLAAQGLTGKQIADRCGVTHSTVRTVLSHGYRALGVSTRTQAVLIAARAGWYGLEIVDPDNGFEITPFMSAYLDAFDRFIRHGQSRDRTAMSIALLGIRNEGRR
jgi:hypothetical protein